MHFGIYEIISFIIILLTALNIKLMSSPKTAVMGNRLGSAAMLVAIIMVLIHNNIFSFPLLIISMLIGGVAGAVLATKTTTLKLPQLVAMFNGFGGGASLLVSIIVITESHINLNFSNHIASFFAVIIGAVTLSGSIIAALKLDGRIEQKPVVIKGHNLLSLGSIVLFVLLIITSLIFKNHIIAIGITTAIIALLFGVLFTIRIGGADMPVVISLLNSYSGIAASICGFAINSLLLVSIGAVVGAAGFILTNIMCKAMNRSLINVLIGGRPISKQTPIKEPSKESEKKPAKESTKEPVKESENSEQPDESEILTENSHVTALQNAEKVVIVPGYGMAVAQAQWKIKKIYETMEAKGIDVKFGIHPVAGRMPGHMNVLLAEVDIPYEKLYEMDQINPQFKETDVVIVVGACDVVNPAAVTAKDTPIYGMPILEVHKAANIIVCNIDTKPGYSGVDNSLYEQKNVTMLLGSADETLDILNDNFKTV